MLYAAADRGKKKKKRKKGFIWMVTASVSACALSAAKSLPQKLHVWDPSKNNPLPTLVLPHSPFVYQKGQNIMSLTTHVMQNHQARGWNDLSSSSRMVFIPQRSRNPMETPANITPTSSSTSQLVSRELGVSCSSESVLAPPSPAALFYLTNFNDGIPDCWLQDCSLTTNSGHEMLTGDGWEMAFTSSEMLAISKENFLSNPHQNLKIQRKIIQQRQIETHTLPPAQVSKRRVIKVRNKMSLSQSCQKEL